MAPAMPCNTSKKSKHGETHGKTNDSKSKLACILEASESTRLRMEESLPNYHEDHIAGKDDNSLQHFNLVHKFILMPQAMKIPAAKAAVDKEWEKLEKISAWNLTKVRNKSEVIDEARTKGAKVHFASLMDICHLENADWRLSSKNLKVELYSEAILWRLRWTSSWRSICLYPGQNGRCSQIIENSKIGVSRHLDSSTTTQMAKIMVQYGRSSRSWTKSVRSSFGRTGMGKAIWENRIEVRLGEGFQLGMLIRTPWKRVILICVCGWQNIGWKETKHESDAESTQQRSRLGRTNIFPWSCIPGM